jgi:N-acetylmuramoyl-L-alanine amidase
MAILNLYHDPGHGGTSEGVFAGGLLEKDWTLDFATDVHSALGSWHVNQAMSRLGDDSVTFSARASKAAHFKADLALVYHVNAKPVGERTEMRGLMCFAKPGDRDAIEVGQSIIYAAPHGLRRHARNVYLAEDNGWTQRAHRTLKDYSCPAVLVECGFATSPRDIEVLTKTQHRPELVAAVLVGVARMIALRGRMEK